MQNLLTAKGLAELSGLALQTIYNRHANSGSLPRCIKLGNRLRFQPDDVHSWLADCYESQENSAPELDICMLAPARRGRPTKQEQVERRRRVLNDGCRD
ncbi:MAG: helix-turn-helix domain-containing protein [Azonexus sp.]|nr:helix-turn-helix domain-containing protein [Azonexus sp.]